MALGSAVVAVCLLGVRHGIAGSLGVPVLAVPWTLGVALAVAALAAGAGTAAVAAWSATRTLRCVSWRPANDRLATLRRALAGGGS